MSGGYARPIYVTPIFRIRQRRVRASGYSLSLSLSETGICLSEINLKSELRY